MEVDFSDAFQPSSPPVAVNQPKYVEGKMADKDISFESNYQPTLAHDTLHECGKWLLGTFQHSDSGFNKVKLLNKVEMKKNLKKKKKLAGTAQWLKEPAPQAQCPVFAAWNPQ